MLDQDKKQLIESIKGYFNSPMIHHLTQFTPIILPDGTDIRDVNRFVFMQCKSIEFNNKGTESYNKAIDGIKKLKRISLQSKPPSAGRFIYSLHFQNNN